MDVFERDTYIVIPKLQKKNKILRSFWDKKKWSKGQYRNFKFSEIFDPSNTSFFKDPYANISNIDYNLLTYIEFLIFLSFSLVFVFS